MKLASLTTTHGEFYLFFDHRTDDFIFDCRFTGKSSTTERYSDLFLSHFAHQMGFLNGPADFLKVCTDSKSAQCLLEWVINQSGLVKIPSGSLPTTVAASVSGITYNGSISVSPAPHSITFGPYNAWQVTTVVDCCEPMPDHANNLTRMANVIREKTDAMEGMTKEIKELKEEIEDLKKDIQFYRDCEAL